MSRFKHNALRSCAAAAMLAGCGGSQPLIGAPGAVSQTSANAMHADRGGLGPFLYVGGWKLSMYALGSTKPLHSGGAPYVALPAIALDSHGDLCESNGNVTYPAIYAFNARKLKLEGTFDGAGYGALAADRSGYLYSTNGVDILVYAPGCTHNIHVIRGCGCWPLVFDEKGNLYAGAGRLVRVYAPRKKRGYMKLVRMIHDGIDGTNALAVGPSGDLFVANSANSSVTVFASGGSEPTRQITKGIGSPVALAVDSKGRLYVANQPESAAGWISVYSTGGTKPIRKIGDSKHFFPDSLAVDPSDNVYVGIRSAVNVYTPGGAKLLRRIANHAIEGTWALLIGSP